MIEYLTFNFNELLKEVKNRARSEGVVDRTAYNGIIDQVLEEQLEQGELDEDNAIESIRQKLQATWEIFNRSRF